MNAVTFHNRYNRLPAPVARQRGVVLIVSLILLMVLTLIGVTAMQTSTLEERMAGNAWDNNRAFQAAEAALRAAENRLDTSIDDVVGDGVPGDGFGGEIVYREDATDLHPEPWGADINDPDLSNWESFTDDAMATMELEEDPHYIIELLARGVAAETVADKLGEAQEQGDVYRVTAYGWGATKSSRVVLQSFYLAN